MTPIDANARIGVTLAAQQWQTVLAALYEMPYRMAAPLIGDITGQIEAGTNPQRSAPADGDAPRIEEAA